MDDETTKRQWSIPMTAQQRMELELKRELEAMIERLEELEEWADGEGYRAFEHKVQEARGRLVSAAQAMEDYAKGRLTRRVVI